MYIENAAWVRDALAVVSLPEGARVIDVGSSTLHYRTIEQPHVEREVLAPLRARGLRLTHLDGKEAEGVDVVQDLDTATPELAERLGTFDLVLCIGLLGYVKEPTNTLDVVASLVSEDGWLVSTTPESYRRTRDPHDNMWRPTASRAGRGVRATGVRGGARRVGADRRRALLPRPQVAAQLDAGRRSLAPAAGRHRPAAPAGAAMALARELRARPAPRLARGHQPRAETRRAGPRGTRPRPRATRPARPRRA